MKTTNYKKIPIVSHALLSWIFGLTFVTYEWLFLRNALAYCTQFFFSFHFSETRTACQTKSSCLKVISRGYLEKELNRLNIPPSHRFDAVICKGHFLFFGAKKIRFEGKIRRHFFKKLILWPINRGFTTGAS